MDTTFWAWCFIWALRLGQVIMRVDKVQTSIFHFTWNSNVLLATPHQLSSISTESEPVQTLLDKLSRGFLPDWLMLRVKENSCKNLLCQLLMTSPPPCHQWSKLLGKDVRKPVNALRGLKVKVCSINFSCIEMFFTAYYLCGLRLFKFKTEGQTM